MSDDEKALMVEQLAKDLDLAGILVMGWENEDGPPQDPIVFYAGATPGGEAQAKKIAETMALLVPRFNQ